MSHLDDVGSSSDHSPVYLAKIQLCKGRRYRDVAGKSFPLVFKTNINSCYLGLRAVNRTSI